MQRAVCPTQTALDASNEEQEDGGKVFARYCSWTISILKSREGLLNGTIVLIHAVQKKTPGALSYVGRQEEGGSISGSKPLGSLVRILLAGAQRRVELPWE